MLMVLITYSQTSAVTNAPDPLHNVMKDSLLFIIVFGVMILMAGIIYVFSRYLHLLAKESVEKIKSSNKLKLLTRFKLCALFHAQK